ncbi:MAG: UDP-N-acetylmuramate--L-alanine ligase, partial [Christensenellales bacterium]
MLTFDEIRNIRFVGVCGASLSVLATLCLDMGLSVSGSDLRDCDIMDYLRGRGVDCTLGHDVSTIRDTDLVVYSSAISLSDPELAFARKVGVPCIERKDFLPLIASRFDKTISVSGSHGKTTTSLMIEHVMRKLGCKFAAHIGGEEAGVSFEPVYTGNEYFLSEACEYRRSFLCLQSWLGVVTSIDYDHPDTYSDERQYAQAFEEYRKRCVKCITTQECASVFSSRDNLVVCGFLPSCDYYASNLEQDKGKFTYALTCGGESAVVRLAVVGKHNVVNSMLAIAVLRNLGFSLGGICEALSDFEGVKRRMECKGKTERGARVIVDYAHHPTEIKTAIDTALMMTRGKIWVVFQPHTYSRTAALLDGFVDSFYWCDELIIAPTYSARENKSDGVDAFDLYCALVERGKMACYIDDDKKIADYLAKSAESNDLILILGAGDIAN